MCFGHHRAQSRGIGEEAFVYVKTQPVLYLIQLFCYPKLLREHPMLLSYYRHVAAIPQKFVKKLTKIDL